MIAVGRIWGLSGGEGEGGPGKRIAIGRWFVEERD